MFANFFSTIREWFVRFFEEVTLLDLIPFITGIVFGMILSVLIYVIILMTTIKREQRFITQCENQVDDETIQKAIQSAQNVYREEALPLNAGEKIAAIKNISWDLINDIAKLHYPDSKYPIYELSIDEILMLNHYITKRIEHIFDRKILRRVRKLKLSTIVKYLDMKKKIDENKLVKAAQTTTRSKTVQFLFTALNSINPVFWAKKVFTSAIIPAATNRIATLIIDIVGEETRRVYSKSAFIDDEVNSEMKKTIDILEDQIENEMK
ncbi:MAG: hypothetical protein PHY42_04610 [Bacilli bacterium]|nr:hypothetical protein [Bacilli bacterium]